jgi:enoyl-CoA hydratase/carnithine racemase
MLGERIGAQRLQELGLVNRVTESGHALDEALALAERLNARAPNALASIKELVTEAAEASLNQQLVLERDHFVRNLHHANADIGIAAFLSKQPARYE